MGILCVGSAYFWASGRRGTQDRERRNTTRVDGYRVHRPLGEVGEGAQLLYLLLFSSRVFCGS